MDKFALIISHIARIELGTTELTRDEIAEVLHSVAYAIQTQDVAEDFSAITLDD